jgi:hypothetical protein
MLDASNGGIPSQAKNYRGTLRCQCRFVTARAGRLSLLADDRRKCAAVFKVRILVLHKTLAIRGQSRV